MIRRLLRIDRTLALPFLLCSLASFHVCSNDLRAKSIKDDGHFTDGQLEFFEKEVRPLLAKRCYGCHSGTAEKLKGGLRLDSRALVLAGGDTGPAAVAGNPAESLLVDSINYGEMYQMPPKSKLPDKEIAILTRWVAEGLPWPADEMAAGPDPASDFNLDKRRAAHWCWQPIRRQRPPRVTNRSWPLQPLDKFILSQLEKNNLSPAAPTDRRSLIRRAYFDLIGLPPTPAEVETFIADPDPAAFATVVDQLLESPHFGERWARHWMDLVRYAESHGHEFDYPIHHAYQYRDYLIRSLNADVPYDQFIIEHLAGDLLSDPRRNPDSGFNESIIGTGFWFLGEATHAPVDILGDQATRVDNQLDVMAKSFLGITLACARCHDHKFDAISTRDYYSMFGYLQSSRRHTSLLDPGGKIASTIDAMDVELSHASVQVDAALTGLERMDGAALTSYLEAVREIGEDNHEAVANHHGLDEGALRRLSEMLMSDATRQVNHPFHLWRLTADVPAEQVKDVVSRLRSAQILLATQSQDLAVSHPVLPISTESDQAWTLAGQAFPPTRASNLVLANGPPHFAPAQQLHTGRIAHKLEGTIRSPTFTLTHKNIHLRLKGNAATVRLILDGYYMDEFNALLFRGFKINIKEATQFSWHTLGADVGRYIGHQGYIEVLDHGGGYIAIDQVVQSDAGPPPAQPSPVLTALFANAQFDNHADVASAYARWWESLPARWPSTTRTAADTALVNSLLSIALPIAPSGMQEKLAAAQQKYVELSANIVAPMKVLSITDGDGKDQPVYIRGNPHTQGEPVPRRFITALANSSRPVATGPGSGRLTLARQIASDDNPLTTRVIVNRCWHQLFGKGLVASVDNFGVLGEQPSHPRLLDYLATTFIKDGWSIKRLLRRMMLSRTYQMSSHGDPQQDLADPTNRLLHRAHVRRLQGEVIRDSLLAVSGRLDGTALYGPPVPVHITPFMTGRGRPGVAGPLDGNGRRSLYISIRRNFLSPMMLAFDMPIPFSSMGRRNVSNVPSQSLILMNDPFVIQQAGIWGTRIAAIEELTREQRIGQMFQEALARQPTDNELQRSMAFLSSQADEYNIPADNIDRDARPWSDLGHVLFNMKSFIFLY